MAKKPVAPRPLPPFWTRTPDGIDIRYPGLPRSNPAEMFGPDTLLSLRRRLLEFAAEPGDLANHVSHAEIERVIALNPGAELTDDILDARARSEPPRPRGRPRPTGLRGLIRSMELHAAAQCYRKRLVRLKRLKARRPLDRWRARQRYDDSLRTPSELALEYARRRHFPHISHGRLRNLFSEAGM